VVGRADRVIVTGGENVRAEEVEEALLAAGASDAVVVGIPDPEWGSVVAGAVVTNDLERVVALVRGDLPGFAIPKLLVRVEAIPRTSMGKPDLDVVASLLEER
jgi:acyl-coenzyme A synthetase/AMP-(fatty) acid ligase